jgi:hypothetical protein
LLGERAEGNPEILPRLLGFFSTLVESFTGYVESFSDYVEPSACFAATFS